MHSRRSANYDLISNFKDLPTITFCLKFFQVQKSNIILDFLLMRVHKPKKDGRLDESPMYISFFSLCNEKVRNSH